MAAAAMDDGGCGGDGRRRVSAQARVRGRVGEREGRMRGGIR